MTNVVIAQCVWKDADYSIREVFCYYIYLGAGMDTFAKKDLKLRTLFRKMPNGICVQGKCDILVDANYLSISPAEQDDIDWVLSKISKDADDVQIFKNSGDHLYIVNKPELYRGNIYVNFEL